MGFALEASSQASEEVVPRKRVVEVSQSHWEVGLGEDDDLQGGIFGGIEQIKSLLDVVGREEAIHIEEAILLAIETHFG